jgi:translation initiation factor IF-1
MGRGKHVNSIVSSLPEPSETQAIVVVTGIPGGNLLQVEDAERRAFLCRLPAKFRNRMWVLKGGHLIVDMAQGDEDGEAAGKVQATLLVAPQLIAYISEETKKEADITKASRKAREERLMARTGLSATDVGKLLADEAAKGATGMEGQEQGPRRRSRRTKK